MWRRAVRRAVGGAARLARLTGARVRFCAGRQESPPHPHPGPPGSCGPGATSVDSLWDLIYMTVPAGPGFEGPYGGRRQELRRDARRWDHAHGRRGGQPPGKPWAASCMFHLRLSILKIIRKCMGLGRGSGLSARGHARPGSARRSRRRRVSRRGEVIRAPHCIFLAIIYSKYTGACENDFTTGD